MQFVLHLQWSEDGEQKPLSAQTSPPELLELLLELLELLLELVPNERQEVTSVPPEHRSGTTDEGEQESTLFSRSSHSDR